jgi:hypothetical protein
VDDSSARRWQIGNNSLRQQDSAQDIRVEHIADMVGVDCAERSIRRNASAVHENIDTSAPINHIPQESIHRIGSYNVDFERERPSSGRCDVVHDSIGGISLALVG